MKLYSKKNILLLLLAVGLLACSWTSSSDNTNGDFDSECKAILQEWYKDGQKQYASVLKNKRLTVNG
ncbi:MAG: hypothetical protein IJ894_15685, partial [Bacteroidales bacterium]|nr:hypothetical protein [Bacteroidales bacterium]